MNSKLSKKDERKQTRDAVKALDEQIVMSRNYAAEVLTCKGVGSCEYAIAMENLKTLTEARAALADSCPKRKKVDPTAIVAGCFGLAQVGMLLVFDENHVVPKWFKTGIDRLSDFIPKVKD